MEPRTDGASAKKNDSLGWEGLYAWIEKNYLEDRSDEWDDWGGLTSRNGGYWGVWMEPRETSRNSRFAIWIEQDRISFRLYGAKTKRSVTGMEREKTFWARAFVENGEGRFVKPRRLNATKTKPMCVSEWRGWLEFGKDGLLDVEESVGNIDRAKQMLLDTI